jgi:hypothetical protein
MNSSKTRRGFQKGENVGWIPLIVYRNFLKDRKVQNTKNHKSVQKI